MGVGPAPRRPHRACSADARAGRRPAPPPCWRSSPR